MSKEKDVHVTPHPDGGWQVKRDNAERASSRHETQADATERGREIARRDGVELHIHGKGGQVRKRSSHGNESPYRDRA